jgi:2-hydroxyglutaryl-CoA dehydratase, D-component
MNAAPRKLSLDEWDGRYQELINAGLRPSSHGGPLREHVTQRGDLRLCRLQLDNSAAALRLWNLVLSENDRLRQARANGDKIVGTMKDLGTVPVLAYSLPRVRAFYPDGAWWTPCLMEGSDGLLRQADALGLEASLCPVRAMVPAFLHGQHFPAPDLLICSSGAVCDDFSAIAQRLENLGFPILWWEIPRRRSPDPGEPFCCLPGGVRAPRGQVECVREELERVGGALSALAGTALTTSALAAGIQRANQVRRLLNALRTRVHSASGAPLPALEMLLAEVLAIHYCSDFEQTVAVLEELLAEASRRAAERQFVLDPGSVRVFWVNPVADLRALNRLEELGGRICGTDYMFTHALDLIPEDMAPLTALAQIALSDPMIGPATARAARVVRECRAFGAEAVVVSRIPGASHCAREGAVIRQMVEETLGLPTVELEVPPVSDSLLPVLSSRLQAVMEIARARRPS